MKFFQLNYLWQYSNYKVDTLRINTYYYNQLLINIPWNSKMVLKTKTTGD